MAAVLTAAIALDAAIATFNTTLATYLDACQTANGAFRAANKGGENARLSDPESAVRCVLGQTLRSALALRGIVISRMSGLTLASLHAAD
jgi:hypothetical protein